MISYKIIQSGSQGNAVIVEDILFDCGVAYSKLQKYLPDINFILITHTHYDHLRITTLNRIRREYPRIVILGNHDVAMTVGTKHILGTKTLVCNDWKVTPIELIHDVPTTGFLIERDGLDIVYATDTHDLSMIDKDKKFDYFFIESNHDERKIEMLRGKQNEYGYDVWANAQRHMSKQKAESFYYAHRKNKDSKFIELHKSKRFY